MVSKSDGHSTIRRIRSSAMAARAGMVARVAAVSLAMLVAEETVALGVTAQLSTTSQVISWESADLAVTVVSEVPALTTPVQAMAVTAGTAVTAAQVRRGVPTVVMAELAARLLAAETVEAEATAAAAATVMVSPSPRPLAVFKRSPVQEATRALGERLLAVAQSATTDSEAKTAACSGSRDTGLKP